VNAEVSGDAGDLVFRPGHRGDDAELRRLNAEAFPSNPKTRPEITAWQWWDNPFGETIVHVWEQGDRLVGQYVAYRMPALLDGEPGRVAIGVDYAIAPSHRGQGLGKPMLDACFGQATAEGTPFYSLPNQLSVGGATRSGLAIVAQLEVRVLPTDPAAIGEVLRESERVAQAGAAGRAGVALAGALAGPATRALRRRASVPARLSVEVLDDPPDDVDALWSAVARHHPWGVARHGDWWRWRYSQHPDRPYRIVAVRRDGHLVACSAVVTRDDLGGRFHSLLELLAVDETAARAVVGTIAEGAVGPADGIACTAMPGSRLSQLAAGAGLVRIPPRVLPRPVYFGVIPCPGVVPDPTAVAWSTAWGDLDHI
jgi:GNAT superfamily N-acetyltransferase